MINESELKKVINKYLNCNLLELNLLGSGANGEVYGCVIDNQPYKIALKITNYPEMLLKEVNSINFINDRVDIKLPTIYFYHLSDNEISLNIMGMSYLDGVGADKINWVLNSKQRKLFTKDVIDNFLNLQQITNDKYGVVEIGRAHV